MKGWLLDTNVVSELRKPSPDRKVVQFVRNRPLDELYVSVVTLAEVRYGIELVSEPIRRSEIAVWLESKLWPMFEGRVLPVTENVLFKWRLIIDEGRRKGHTFTHPDVLIAATAAQHGLVVVSSDIPDFVAANVGVLNPWTGTLIEPTP